MHARLQGAALGQLRGADLELGPGRYVVLSTEREPLVSLVAVLAGREPAQRGSVRLDGNAPYSSPATRRQIAALFYEEALPPALTVERSVAKALSARGAPHGDAGQLLVDAGLSRLAGLALGTLGQREVRSVALALALTHDSAQLCALHEPLTTLVPASYVLARLDEQTARGAIVLTATTSPADATTLGGHWLCVELGRVRWETATPRLGPGAWQQVLVETKDARALSALLHDSPLGLSTELGASPHSLKVTGPALDVTVAEISALARKHELELRRIEAAVPPVEALMAARAGFARGAYEASRSAALGGAPAVGEPRPAADRPGSA